MKRIILVAVILLAASVDMQAQMVKFGIKGGLNYANQTGSDITITNANQGLNDKKEQMKKQESL